MSVDREVVKTREDTRSNTEIRKGTERKVPGKDITNSYHMSRENKERRKMIQDGKSRWIYLF